MKHTITVMVENKFGVLARVAGLFSARGYNIASLAVSETLDPQISAMTIVVQADDEKILEQIDGGDLTTRVALRKTDQLADLKGSLNVFINSLDGRMGRIKLILEEARTLLSRKEDPKTLAKLEATIARLKDEIEHFKVTSKREE